MLLTQCAVSGQWLDRVAASAGNTAITERDVTLECRFETFLEGRVPLVEYDSAARKAAADRLVSQALLRQELESVPGQNAPNSEAARRALGEVRTRFSSAAEYQAAVERLGLSSAEIGQRIADYQQTLEMIDERFQPVAPPSEADVANYYRTSFEPEFLRQYGRPAPPLKDVEKQIREILVQQDIDQLLQKWLDQMRSTQHVRMLQKP